MNKNNIWGIVIALIVGLLVGWYGYSMTDKGSMDAMDTVTDNGSATGTSGSGTTGTQAGSANAGGTTSSYVAYTGKVTTEKQYVQLMVANQQAAIAMSQQVLALNPRNEIATLAKNVISSEASQLKQLKDWLASWK
ncbi:MAG: hypothetical protein JWN37_822 [Candidatus Nomurabacteria bacterium]|nr:hypothetical protein [Candidatus Nomurabacteria bacterium]